MLLAKVKELLRVCSLIITTVSCAGKAEIEWQYTADLDGDGTAEAVRVVDLNGNGRPDKIGDLHLSGRKDSLAARLWSEAEFDLDGEPDELRIYIDRNGDGSLDTTEGWLRRALDLDDDGRCDDTDSDLHELDITGKGFVQLRTRYQDFDGDGDADLVCDYPSHRLEYSARGPRYVTGNRCMRQTWRGILHGFGYRLYLDDDDDDNLNWDGDGAGTSQHRVRRPQVPLGSGLEGRHSTGEAHRWYDFDGDGYSDMHLRDYGPGIMRWSFDWDGDAPRKFPLDKAVPAGDSHADYDVAFHTLGEVPRGWWAGDQLKFWDFAAALDLPGYYRQPGTAYDFGRDFVPAASCVYYTLHAPWKIISLNWLEDQEDALKTKDAGCHRWEGIWSYYYDFDPKAAFIGSRRDFDRDANSSFQLYLSPIDSLYHLYEAEDGIWYRDPDCRRNHFMLRPTKENVRKYVREIITYSDSDDDGFFDTFAYDRNLDGEPEEIISKPGADQAGLTDMTGIWRFGEDLDSLYNPGPEDRAEVDLQVTVDWEERGYDLLAKISLSASRPLNGYRLWLRAEENVDYNILCRLGLQEGRSSWNFNEAIPRAQFILPGRTSVEALLVNNVGRIVGRYPVASPEIEPLNSPSMYVGFYRIWRGEEVKGRQRYTQMEQIEQIRVGESIKLEVGLELLTSRKMTLLFEPFLTDDQEVSRRPLGRQVYRADAGEMLLSAVVTLVPFGEDVLQAAGGESDPSLPVSLEDYLGIREQGDRVYIPGGRSYRIGFRLYAESRLVEERILYYDWRRDRPQTIRVSD